MKDQGNASQHQTHAQSRRQILPSKGSTGQSQQLRAAQNLMFPIRNFKQQAQDQAAQQTNQLPSQTSQVGSNNPNSSQGTALISSGAGSSAVGGGGLSNKRQFMHHSQFLEKDPQIPQSSTAQAVQEFMFNSNNTNTTTQQIQDRVQAGHSGSILPTPTNKFGSEWVNPIQKSSPSRPIIASGGHQQIIQQKIEAQKSSPGSKNQGQTQAINSINQSSSSVVPQSTLQLPIQPTGGPASHQRKFSQRQFILDQSRKPKKSSIHLSFQNNQAQHTGQQAMQSQGQNQVQQNQTQDQETKMAMQLQSSQPLDQVSQELYNIMDMADQSKSKNPRDGKQIMLKQKGANTQSSNPSQQMKQSQKINQAAAAVQGQRNILNNPQSNMSYSRQNSYRGGTTPMHQQHDQSSLPSAGGVHNQTQTKPPTNTRQKLSIQGELFLSHKNQQHSTYGSQQPNQANQQQMDTQNKTTSQHFHKGNKHNLKKGSIAQITADSFSKNFNQETALQTSHPASWNTTNQQYYMAQNKSSQQTTSGGFSSNNQQITPSQHNSQSLFNQQANISGAQYEEQIVSNTSQGQTHGNMSNISMGVLNQNQTNQQVTSQSQNQTATKPQFKRVPSAKIKRQRFKQQSYNIPQHHNQQVEEEKKSSNPHLQQNTQQVQTSNLRLNSSNNPAQLVIKSYHSQQQQQQAQQPGQTSQQISNTIMDSSDSNMLQSQQNQVFNRASYIPKVPSFSKLQQPSQQNTGGLSKKVSLHQLPSPLKQQENNTQQPQQQSLTMPSNKQQPSLQLQQNSAQPNQQNSGGQMRDFHIRQFKKLQQLAPVLPLKSHQPQHTSTNISQFHNEAITKELDHQTLILNQTKSRFAQIDKGQDQPQQQQQQSVIESHIRNTKIEQESDLLVNSSQKVSDAEMGVGNGGSQEEELILEESKNESEQFVKEGEQEQQIDGYQEVNQRLDEEIDKIQQKLKGNKLQAEQLQAQKSKFQEIHNSVRQEYSEQQNHFNIDQQNLSVSLDQSQQSQTARRVQGLVTGAQQQVLLPIQEDLVLHKQQSSQENGEGTGSGASNLVINSSKHSGKGILIANPNSNSILHQMQHNQGLKYGLSNSSRVSVNELRLKPQNHSGARSQCEDPICIQFHKLLEQNPYLKEQLKNLKENKDLLIKGKSTELEDFVKQVHAKSKLSFQQIVNCVELHSDHSSSFGQNQQKTINKSHNNSMNNRHQRLMLLSNGERNNQQFSSDFSRMQWSEQDTNNQNMNNNYKYRLNQMQIKKCSSCNNMDRNLNLVFSSSQLSHRSPQIFNLQNQHTLKNKLHLNIDTTTNKIQSGGIFSNRTFKNETTKHHKNQQSKSMVSHQILHGINQGKNNLSLPMIGPYANKSQTRQDLQNQDLSDSQLLSIAAHNNFLKINQVQDAILSVQNQKGNSSNSQNYQQQKEQNQLSSFHNTSSGSDKRSPDILHQQQSKQVQIAKQQLIEENATGVKNNILVNAANNLETNNKEQSKAEIMLQKHTEQNNIVKNQQEFFSANPKVLLQNKQPIQEQPQESIQQSQQAQVQQQQVPQQTNLPQIRQNINNTYQQQIQQLKLPQQHQIFGKIKKWKKGKLIGQGRTGSVYLAMDQDVGTMFAVKIINIHSNITGVDQNAIKTLKTEVTSYKLLAHPNIVKYIGSEILGSDFCIYLELVPEGSLQDLYHQYEGYYTEHTCRRYIKQILDGLAHLHSRGIMHGDLKGANVLVDKQCQVKLCDFGSSESFLTNSTSFKELKEQINGSLAWMAPEAIEKGRSKRSDIWSLGMIVIEMLVGGNPWGNKIDENIFRAVELIAKSDEIPKPPNYVSAECKDFVNKCLQRDYKKRPHAHELLDHPWLKMVFN